MIRRYHVPSWTGDFELVGKDDGTSLLVVEDPTPDELAKLRTFLGECRAKGWLDPLLGLSPVGRSELLLTVPLSQSGPLLAGAAMPDQGKLTAVRSKAGSILAVVLGVDPQEPAKIEQAATRPEASTAVTVRRPTICCPQAIEGPLVRSSRVLRAFSTPRQWQNWQEHGWLLCSGSHTGHTYRIAHRHHSAAREQGKIVYDLDAGAILHCYDWQVPPAEEVLACKLFLEHAEPMLRCEGSTPWESRKIWNVRSPSDFVCDPAPTVPLPLDAMGEDAQLGAAGELALDVLKKMRRDDLFDTNPRLRSPYSRGGMDGTWDAGFLSRFADRLSVLAGHAPQPPVMTVPLLKSQSTEDHELFPKGSGAEVFVDELFRCDGLAAFRDPQDPRSSEDDDGDDEDDDGDDFLSWT